LFELKKPAEKYCLPAFLSKRREKDLFEKIKIVLDISEMVCYYNRALKNAEYIAG